MGVESEWIPNHYNVLWIEHQRMVTLITPKREFSLNVCLFVLFLLCNNTNNIGGDHYVIRDLRAYAHSDFLKFDF